MEKIWLKSYPPGVPAEIDASAYTSVGELLEDSFRQYRASRAFVCMGKSITYGELDTLSQQAGAWFQAKGLARGARVAIMMPNVLQYPVVLAAVLRAGYVVVNVNPLYTPRELEHQLKDSGAEAIVLLENFAVTLQAVVRNTAIKHVVVASMGDLMGLKGHIVNFVVRRVKKMVPAWDLPGHVKFNDMLAQGSRLSFAAAKLTRDDVAFLQYTGGTTGVAKGATLTHGNIVANVLQSAAWHEPAHSLHPEVTQIVNVIALPLYHIYALTV
ncbi:MAG: AMP-binding protein, partial [Burkholderiales bacterium]|nr:AMP-binding protein [Burkholderiales bacterium]